MVKIHRTKYDAEIGKWHKAPRWRQRRVFVGAVLFVAFLIVLLPRTFFWKEIIEGSHHYSGGPNVGAFVGLFFSLAFLFSTYYLVHGSNPGIVTEDNLRKALRAHIRAKGEQHEDLELTVERMMHGVEVGSGKKGGSSSGAVGASDVTINVEGDDGDFGETSALAPSLKAAAAVGVVESKEEEADEEIETLDDGENFGLTASGNKSVDDDGSLSSVTLNARGGGFTTLKLDGMSGGGGGGGGTPRNGNRAAGEGDFSLTGRGADEDEEFEDEEREGLVSFVV